MKQVYLIVLFVCAGQILSNALFAQPSYTIANDSSGIYLTYADFESGTIANGFPNQQKGHTIWPKGFFVSKDLELKTPDTTIVYKRSDIWGYVHHKGQLFRVFDNKYYKVLCDKGIVIYIIDSPTSVSYHFSKTLNAPIYRLKRRNLIQQYTDNAMFLQRLNTSRKKHWLIWNEQKESYRLNEMLNE